MGALTVVGLALALSLFIARSAEGTGICGERKLTADALIANGYTARSGAWPWHGAMFHRYRLGIVGYVCGVTILTEQFVLTAAHCTYERGSQSLPANRLFVKVGFSNLDSPEDRVRQFDVDKIARHEEYDMDSFENDIALLKLSCEIIFTNYIQPVCLWQGDTELSKIISKIGFIVGWGLDEGFNLPKHLSEATIPIVSSKTCRKSNNWHFYKHYFESKTFCAGRRNGTHVSHGDSGGGLYMRMGSNWILRGFVSNAQTNPSTLNVQAASYTIFTDVAYYLNWINTRVPVIPYLAVNTEQITETEFNGDENLLDLRYCGKYTHPSGTQEEGNELVNLYPWEAAINRYDPINEDYGNQCVGLLIHPIFLITMASCFKPSDFRQIFAFFNEFGSSSNSSTVIRIRDVFKHPDYSFRKNTNDIAMTKLERPATMNPICLPLLDPLQYADASQLHTIGVNIHEKQRYFHNVTQMVDFEVCQREFSKVTRRENLTAGQACSRSTFFDRR